MAELTSDALRVADRLDSDADGIMNPDDNCVDVPNADQKDRDRDGYGNACDPGEAVRPRVRLISPPAGSQYVLGDTISIAAQASDPDGTVTLVRFQIERLEGGMTRSQEQLGEVLQPPYRLDWQAPLAGRYRLSAEAFDNHWASATSKAVMVTIRPLAPSRRQLGKQR